MMGASKFVTTDCQGHAELSRMLSVFSLKNLVLFMAEFNWVLNTADKVVLAACVLHSYLSNDVSVEDCVIDNKHAPSQFSYVTTFCCSGGSASEEVTRVREKYRQYFEYVGSVPRQLEAIRRACKVLNQHNIRSLSSLSYDRSKASSKASSIHSAIQSFLLQMRVSSPFLKVIQ